MTTRHPQIGRSLHFSIDAWSLQALRIFCLLLFAMCLMADRLRLFPSIDVRYFLCNAIELAVLLPIAGRANRALTAIFFVYAYLVFVFAYPIYNGPFAPEGQTFFLIIASGFLLGRYCRLTPLGVPGGLRIKRTDPEASTLVPRSLILGGITMKAAFIGYLLSTVGLAGYFTGAFMAEKVDLYASHAPLLVLENVAQLGGSILCVAGIAACVQSGCRRRGLFVAALIVLPVLSLDRGSLVAGIIALIYIFRDKIRARHLVIGAAFAFGMAFFFGNIRMRDFGGTGRLSPLGSVVGELSVADDVHLIVETVHEEGIAYGRQLLAPFLAMPVPRALYPAKPKLTSEIIMEKYYPDAARSGFFLAPTIFGDWFYNFGYPGVACISFALGLLITDIEISSASALGVVTSYYFYSLLRNNFPQSFAFFTIALLLAYSANRIVWRGGLDGIRLRLPAAAITWHWG